MTGIVVTILFLAGCTLSIAEIVKNISRLRAIDKEIKDLREKENALCKMLEDRGDRHDNQTRD